MLINTMFQISKVSKSGKAFLLRVGNSDNNPKRFFQTWVSIAYIKKLSSKHNPIVGDVFSCVGSLFNDKEEFTKLIFLPKDSITFIANKEVRVKGSAKKEAESEGQEDFDDDIPF